MELCTPLRGPCLARGARRRGRKWARSQRSERFLWTLEGPASLCFCLVVTSAGRRRGRPGWRPKPYWVFELWWGSDPGREEQG